MKRSRSRFVMVCLLAATVCAGGVNSASAAATGDSAARRPALLALAERLLEKEVIDNDELRATVEASSPSPVIVPGSESMPRRQASADNEAPGAESGTA